MSKPFANHEGLSGITVCNVIPSCCDDYLFVEILRSGHVINICQHVRCFADVPNMQIMFHNNTVNK